MVQPVEPVVVKKVVRARREAAFYAFTDATKISIWLAGPGERCEVESFEVKEGGVFRLAFHGECGAFAIEGKFLELDPPKRLAMSWRKSGHDADPADSKVTVTFHERGETTEVVVRHEELPSEEAAEEAFRAWTERLIRFGSQVYAQSMMENYMLNPSHDPSGMAGQILEARRTAERAILRFRDTYSHTPADRLHYRPTEHCRSALKIAAHVAVANEHFASVLRGEPQVHRDLPSIFGAQAAKEALLNDPEEVESRLEASFAALLDVLSSIDASVVEANPQLQFYIGLAGYHIANHAAQIDYLQTTWGDLDNHFGS